MNVYEDYINYMNEHSDLIEHLYSTDSRVLVCLDDVIKVNDHIYQMVEKDEKISDELAQIFEIGFGYLVNSINDLETYYKEYLNKDIILFNHYADMMVYGILYEDFKSFLLSNDEYEEEIKKVIEPILTEIEDIIGNKKEFNEDAIKKYSDILEDLDFNEKFRPAYAVFSMIAEELEIY